MSYDLPPFSTLPRRTSFGVAEASAVERLVAPWRIPSQKHASMASTKAPARPPRSPVETEPGDGDGG